jgi:transcriptional regulator with XRE-family HTH domain
MARRITLRQVFQRRLKEARKRARVSQKELGIRAGMDPFSASPRMNRYEKGVYEPDLDTIGRLGKVLGVPSAFFLADEENLARIILLLSSTTHSVRGDILRLLEEHLNHDD